MKAGDPCLYRYRALDSVAPSAVGQTRKATVITIHVDQYGPGHNGHHVRVETEPGDITDHRDPHEFWRGDAPLGDGPGCVSEMK